MPDRNGRIENVVLGYSTVGGYGRDRYNLAALSAVPMRKILFFQI